MTRFWKLLLTCCLMAAVIFTPISVLAANRDTGYGDSGMQSLNRNSYNSPYNTQSYDSPGQYIGNSQPQSTCNNANKQTTGRGQSCNQANCGNPANCGNQANSCNQGNTCNQANCGTQPNNGIQPYYGNQSNYGSQSNSCNQPGYSTQPGYGIQPYYGSLSNYGSQPSYGGQTNAYQQSPYSSFSSLNALMSLFSQSGYFSQPSLNSLFSLCQPRNTTAQTTPSAPSAPSYDTSTGAIAGEQAAEVLRLVNVERAKEGLAPLVADTGMCRAAETRAQEIMSTFSHTRPNGSSCFTALDQAGVNYRTAGENIAIGQRSAAQVVQAWMESPGHRANIMSSAYGRIGLAAIPSSGNYGGYAWTQFFAN